MDDAYQHEQHLIKVREEIERKKNLRKAQHRNKKAMLRKQFEPKEKQDEKLIEKVGIDSRTKVELKTMQENLPIGGNLYFELNRIAYDNDIDRRRRNIESIHDYTLNVSMLCFFIILLFTCRNLQ